MLSKLLQAGLMQLWATIIVLAMMSASKAEDKAERSALSSPIATSFDSCMEVYVKLLKGPIDFKFINFCKQLERGVK